MAAADVERSVNSVIETLLNELEGTFSPKEKKMTALLELWLRSNMYLFRHSVLRDPFH